MNPSLRLLSPPQRAALLRIYRMALDMSGCTSYGEHDENGDYLGVHPDVTRDLETVRRILELPPEKES